VGQVERFTTEKKEKGSGDPGDCVIIGHDYIYGSKCSLGF